MWIINQNILFLKLSNIQWKTHESKKIKYNKLFDHILKAVFCFEKKNIVIVSFVNIFFK